METHVQQGARRYFVRLQCGHVVEAMHLIKEVQGSTRLMRLVPQCAPFARDALSRLVEYLPKASRRPEFEQYIRSIRNRAAFHYDPHLVDAALASRAKRPGSSLSKVTRASERAMWRSGVADDIEDTIVCRFLWKIPISADLGAEANRISEFASGVCRDYIDVAGELSVLFLRETSTV